MGCCSCLARTIIGLVNMIVLIVMIVIICFSWDQIKKINIDEVHSSKNVLIFVIVVIAFIALTCIIGFFMFCYYKSKCFRITYAILYLVVVIIEIVLIACSVKDYQTILEDAETWWIENEGTQDVKDVESDLECCGFKVPYNATEMENCGYQPTNSSNIETCYNKIDEKLKKSKKGIQIAGIVILIIQALLLIYSLWYAFCFNSCKTEKVSSSS